MALYNIQYHTENNYNSEVSEGIFDFLIVPDSSIHQKVIKRSFYNSFHKDVFFYENKFGFEVIRLRTDEAFNRFELSADFEVEVDRVKPRSAEGDTSVEEWFTHAFHIRHHLYLYQTPVTEVSENKSDLLLLHQKGQTVLEYLDELNTYLNKLIKYEAYSTQVGTNADEVLQIKKGVCQDYSHLFLHMARKSKIPCRYVSGYLDQGKNFMGSAQMHAWVEAFVPGCGWLGFDPTNNIRANGDHIKVAHGVDYRDCSPIRGVIKTNGENTTNHSVKVQEQ